MRTLARGDARRGRVYQFLRDYYTANGCPPSYDQIRAGTGIKSYADVSRILGQLQACGLVRRVAAQRGAIPLNPDGSELLLLREA